MDYIMLEPVEPETLGLLIGMLSESDPRPAREQYDDNYAHGGGWKPQPRFTMDDTTLNYPGDPPLQPFAMTVLRQEVILFYPYSVVAIVQPDGSFEACRMD